MGKKLLIFLYEKTTHNFIKKKIFSNLCLVYTLRLHIVHNFVSLPWAILHK